MAATTRGHLQVSAALLQVLLLLLRLLARPEGHDVADGCAEGEGLRQAGGCPHTPESQTHERTGKKLPARLWYMHMFRMRAQKQPILLQADLPVQQGCGAWRLFILTELHCSQGCYADDYRTPPPTGVDAPLRVPASLVVATVKIGKATLY